MIASKNFALFRLPYDGVATLIEQTSDSPVELTAARELGTQQGFVVAPFTPSAERPIVVIRPDRITMTDMHDIRQQLYDYILKQDYTPRQHDSLPSADYHEDFQRFHQAIENGRFQKLVLSRSIRVERSTDALQPIELFYKACALYPRVMVALVSTERSGMWLTATPETLMQGSGTQWQTVALAGTMPYADHIGWSDKNIQEQRYVASFIAEKLNLFADDFSEEGPITARAGHLAHLRSDFHLTLNNATSVGRLIEALHPTPAVCGLPKYEAADFILNHEHNDRSYYSGFMGPFAVNGQTHLFVTLRCMQLFDDHYCLYAGGGLLAESDEQQEWLETEAKLDIMRQLIAP